MTEHQGVCGELMVEEIDMPHGVGKRCLRIHLPRNYHQSEQRYPVVYMQDGQNLFDPTTAFADDWQVDESLETLYDRKPNAGVIIVGVDNAREGRLDEYGPWPFRYEEQTAGGGGGNYARTLAQVIKPHIDNRLRTMPDRAHTVVMGSSMGGLISLYTALAHQHVFGAVAAFSPSIKITGSRGKLRRFIRKMGCRHPLKIYMDMGTEEDEGETEIRVMGEALRRVGFTETGIEVIEGGAHSEASWGARFPEVLVRLLPDHTT